MGCRGVARLVVVWVVAVSAGRSRADPDPAQPAATDDDTIDPSQIPIEPPPPPPRYSRALVERSLLLPEGLAQATAAVGIGHETLGDIALTYSTISVGGAIAIGRFEPYAGIRLLPLYSEPSMLELDLAFVTRIYVGTRLRITRDTAVGAQATARDVDSDDRRYSPSVFAAHKYRPSKRTAIVANGGLSYDSMPDSFDDPRSVSLSASALLEVQLTPVVAGFAEGGITKRWYIGDAAGRDESGLSYSGGGGLSISISARVDLVPSVAVASAGAVDAWGGGLALNVR